MNVLNVERQLTEEVVIEKTNHLTCSAVNTTKQQNSVIFNISVHLFIFFSFNPIEEWNKPQAAALHATDTILTLFINSTNKAVKRANSVSHVALSMLDCQQVHI